MTDLTPEQIEKKRINQNERARRWREKNREIHNTRVRDYYRNKEYTEEERKEKTEATRQWRLNNPKKYKENNSGRYAKNPEEMKEKMRKWQLENPEKYNAYRQKRRSQTKLIEGDFTDNDIVNIFSIQNGECVYCKISLSEKYHIDHIYPLSRGGNNYKENIQLLCPSCNLRKSNKHPLDFEKEIGYIRPLSLLPNAQIPK